MNALLLVLVIVALAAIQMLAGGRHLALSLPSHGLLALGALLSWWPTRGMEIPRRVTASLLASTLFFGYILLRAVFSPEDYLARSDLYMVLGALLVYLLVALNVTSSKLRVRLVLFLLFLAAANLGIGAIQFIKGQNFMLFPFLPRGEYATRASGFFGSPNHLAGFLEVPLMMGLGVACWSRWRPAAKILVAALIVAAIAGIILTGSRGGYLSSLAGLLVFGILSLLIISKRVQKYAVHLLIAGVLLSLVLAWSVQRIIARDVALRDRAKSALNMETSRSLLWQPALKQFQQHPILGAGSGTFRYFGRQYRPLGVQQDPEFVHNEYLHLLAEYGIIGFVALIVFLASHLRAGWISFRSKVWRESETLGIGSNSLALSTGALSAVAACMVHSFVDFNLHIPANALVMAFVFAVLANPGGEIKVSSRQQKDGWRLVRQFRLVTPALGLCVLLFALPTLPAEIMGERARLILSNWRYLESPDVARAAEDFARRGLSYDARNPELYYYLGEALVGQAAQTDYPQEKERLFAESVEAYQSAVELAPGDTRLLICLASSLDAVKRFELAAPLYARAIELFPLSYYPHWAYGQHLALQKKYPEAEAAYRRSLELGGDAAAQLALDRLAAEQKAAAPAPPVSAPVEGDVLNATEPPAEVTAPSDLAAREAP